MLSRAKSIATRVWKDKSGASLLEYSLLIGIIVAVTVATITLVSNWVGVRWASLQAALGL
jgi:pilus assembly protein Flp/PilA